jgi:transforming growth factor-beta-induced protein
VIDKVLVPPGVLDIVQMAKLNPAFSTLVAALETAGLDDDLSGTGAFTVFAPTNDAFTALLNRLSIDATALLASPTLANTLLYHVIPGNVRRSDVLALSNPAFVDTLLGGADLEVRNDTLTLIDDDNGSPDATISATDIRASNGVIHVITQVLIPQN